MNVFILTRFIFAFYGLSSACLQGEMRAYFQLYYMQQKLFDEGTFSSIRPTEFFNSNHIHIYACTLFLGISTIINVLLKMKNSLANLIKVTDFTNGILVDD